MTYHSFDVKRFAAQYLVKLVMSLLGFLEQKNLNIFFSAKLLPCSPCHVLLAQKCQMCFRSVVRGYPA